MTAPIARSSTSSPGPGARTSGLFWWSPAKAACCEKRCRYGLARAILTLSSRASPRPISSMAAPARSMSRCVVCAFHVSLNEAASLHDHGLDTRPRLRGSDRKGQAVRARLGNRERAADTVPAPYFGIALIQENADPDVLRDLADAIGRLAPRDAEYRHTTEGPDDMPAHIRAALTQTSLSIPVVKRAP